MTRAGIRHNAESIEQSTTSEALPMKEAEAAHATQATAQSIQSTWRVSPRDQRRPITICPERLDKEKLLATALDDYCKLLDAGDAPPPSQYCERFPDYRHSLFRLIDVEVMLAGQPDLDDALEDAWPKPMQRFLGYEIIHELGFGAFARVYLAAETALGGRLVALKVSPYGTDEAETLAKLTHPNIVPVFSVQTEELTEMTAVCMPYRGSATLGDLLEVAFREGRPPTSANVILQVPKDREPVVDFVSCTLSENKLDPTLEYGRYVDGVVRLGIQMAEALAYTHRRGILHRDLKPSNVLLTPTGTPMLLDFNLASDVHSNSPRMGGTLPYMSPEQIRDAHLQPYQSNDAGDPRSDIFSLGVILYELLTNKLPFGDPPLCMSPQQAATEYLKAQQQPALPIAKINPQVTPALARTIDQCLSLDLTKRPASATQLARELKRHFGWRAWLNRYRVLFLFVLAVLLLGVTGAIQSSLARPSSYAQHMVAAINSLEAEEYEQAIELFDDAEDANGDATLPILFGRGYSYQQADITPIALAELEQAAKLSPDPLIADCYAHLLVADGKLPRAITYYQTTNLREPTCAMRYVSLAYCKLKWKPDSPALVLSDLTKAIELDPNLQIAYHLRAIANLAAHQDTILDERPRDYYTFENSISDIESAFRVGPANAELHCDAARIYASAAVEDPAFLEKTKEHLTAAIDADLSPNFFKFRDEFLPWRDSPWFLATLSSRGENHVGRWPSSLRRRSILQRSSTEVTNWVRGNFKLGLD